jgi:outer membrane protein assembly factor BamA
MRRRTGRRKGPPGPAGRGWLAALALCLLLSGCTSQVPKSYLPYPLTDDKFDDPVKVVTVPLPVIAASPNEGVTYGALAAFLAHDRKDEISTMIVPQATYNKNFGETTSLYAAIYSSPDRRWEFNLSQSTNVNNDYEARLVDRTLLGGDLEVNAFAYTLTDGSGRFFGFHPSSDAANETNYADAERGFTVSAGYRLTEDLQVVIGERFRDVDIERGAVRSLPDIHERFGSTLPGVDGFTTHAQKLSLVRSTLDSLTLPTRGMYASVGIEGAFRDMGSSDDFGHVEAEIKQFVPWPDERFVTAWRAAYNQTLGGNAPFLERSILGGETTLRGFGRNRFIGDMYLLFNVEERIRLFRWEVFGVNADWELAPFLDVGAVTTSLEGVGLNNFEFNPGVGFRAVVRPNIIGRVDVGWGREGPAVFAGLGYPF